ncbi:unnamed protein product [Aphis gossypii]|uniref:Uncharacterized protein n=1 Tax=Aphis gossypii TaxID=80765 RepID=A0A9P0JFH3_APHGO|nr:unnamed protein product [Aphis gossypii]
MLCKSYIARSGDNNIILHSCTLLPRGDSLRTLARAPQWQRRLRLLRRRGGARVRRTGRAERGVLKGAAVAAYCWRRLPPTVCRRRRHAWATRSPPTPTTRRDGLCCCVVLAPYTLLLSVRDDDGGDGRRERARRYLMMMVYQFVVVRYYAATVSAVATG